MRVRKGVFTAAGLGTRLLPATKAQPKEMLPLVDKPIIQYVVEEAVASGIEQIIIVTGRGKRAIEDHFDIAFALEYFLSKKGDKAFIMPRGLWRFVELKGGELLLREAMIQEEARYDGKWVVRTNTDLPTDEVALDYKRLWHIEQAFRAVALRPPPRVQPLT